MPLTLYDNYLKSFISDEEIRGMQAEVTAAHELLHSGKGPGNDFIGWVDLP